MLALLVGVKLPAVAAAVALRVAVKPVAFGVGLACGL